MDKQIREEIALRVRMDIYNQKDIIEIICKDMYPESKISKAEVKEIIEEEVRKIENEMDRWPERTDVDKLFDIFFINLPEKGIAGIWNAGYTVSEGLTEVDEYWDIENYTAYCFFITQGLEGAVRGDGLHLYFGNTRGNEEFGATKVGKLIVAELEKEGLIAEWNGSESESIFIRNIKWQNRP